MQDIWPKTVRNAGYKEARVRSTSSMVNGTSSKFNKRTLELALPSAVSTS